MSNQIKYQCWSYKPGSSAPQPQRSTPHYPSSQSGQSGRVAGHTMGDNFIPASAAPGSSSDEPPAIGQRGVNRQGQMPFKITKTYSQQVIEGQATPQQVLELFAADGPDFPVFSNPFFHSDGAPCNDPQWEFPTPPVTPSGSPSMPARQSHNTHGYNGHNNRQAMAQGQR